MILASVRLPVLNEIVLFLLFAVIVAVISKRLGTPYTVGLVIMGLAVGLLGEKTGLFSPDGEHFGLTQEVILLVFLPPLLFEGAMNIRYRSLLEGSRLIFVMAFFGTIASTLLIGAATHLVLGWDWDLSLLLGVIVSPTDPVSVLAIFREQGVQKKLSVLVEGESLFNDGTAVVIYLLLLRVIDPNDHVSAGGAVATLFWMVIGGAGIGVVLGDVTNRLLGRIDDHLIEVLISIVLAYGSYILAESLHSSGVIAVVFAGLLVGNVGRKSAMSPTTLVTINSAWEVFAFLANSLVFLAMGFAIDARELAASWGPILLLFAASIVARSLVTYGIGGAEVLVRRRFPWSWLHLLNWGGLKGTIPVALVLGVAAQPDLFPQTATMKNIVFGVILLSLLVQGSTIKSCLRIFGLAGGSPWGRDYELAHGRAIALEAALDELRQLESKAEFPAGLLKEARGSLETQRSGAFDFLERLIAEHPELRSHQERELLRRLLHRQRGALNEAYRKGVVSDQALAELEAEIDSNLLGGTRRAAHTGGAGKTEGA